MFRNEVVVVDKRWRGWFCWMTTWHWVTDKIRRFLLHFKTFFLERNLNHHILNFLLQMPPTTSRHVVSNTSLLSIVLEFLEILDSFLRTQNKLNMLISHPARVDGGGVYGRHCHAKHVAWQILCRVSWCRHSHGGATMDISCVVKLRVQILIFLGLFWSLLGLLEWILIKLR